MKSEYLTHVHQAPSSSTGMGNTFALPPRAVRHYIVLHQRIVVGLVRDIPRKHPCGGKALHGLASSVSCETSTTTHLCCTETHQTHVLPTIIEQNKDTMQM